MFISKVEVDWVKACNPYDLHRAVWNLFPQSDHEVRKNFDESRSGFLFRIEESSPGRPYLLLVQSQLEPQPRGSFIRLIGCREFDPNPSIGQRLSFLLTANPIKTISDTQVSSKPEKKSNKKNKFKCRVPLIKEEHQRAWLFRKFNGMAEIEFVSIEQHSPMFFYRKAKKKDERNSHGKLLTVTFQGVLRVMDPVRLKKVLQDGLGPAKGFGCGLMLVKKKR